MIDNKDEILKNWSAPNVGCCTEMVDIISPDCSMSQWAVQKTVTVLANSDYYYTKYEIDSLLRQVTASAVTREQVEEMIKDVLADVVLCGHTHIPCGYQTASKKSVVNVGSVGRPFTPEPKACYLKLTVTNGKCIFEHRFVEYNKELAASKLSKRSFDGAEKLAEMLLNPTVRHF